MEEPWNDICLLGDSIGQGYWDQSGIGWFGRLAQKIGKNHPYKFSFHNASMSGDTSIDTLHRLSSEVIQRGVNYLVIAVGVNDLIRWHSTDNQTSLALDTSKVTWEQLLGQATKFCDKVLVVGCIPVIEDRMPEKGIFDTPLYCLNRDIIKYNSEVAALCKKYKVPHFDIFAAMPSKKELFKDASHPNSDGHQLISELIYASMEKNGWFGK